MDKKHASKGGHEPCGCPGGKMMDLREKKAGKAGPSAKAPSMLRQWPVQLHLISPMAPYFQKADLVVAADCTAFTYGNFHAEFLKDRAAVIACPKLDDGQESYVEKLQALIEEAKVNTVTVLTMEVPCCGGLLAMVQQAARNSKRKVPVKSVVVGIDGELRNEEWA